MLTFSTVLKMAATIMATFSIGAGGGGDTMLTFVLDLEVVVAVILGFFLVYKVVEAPC